MYGNIIINMLIGVEGVSLLVLFQMEAPLERHEWGHTTDANAQRHLVRVPF